MFFYCLIEMDSAEPAAKRGGGPQAHAQEADGNAETHYLPDAVIEVGLRQNRVGARHHHFTQARQGLGKSAFAAGPENGSTA